MRPVKQHGIVGYGKARHTIFAMVIGLAVDTFSGIVDHQVVVDQTSDLGVHQACSLLGSFCVTQGKRESVSECVE